MVSMPTLVVYPLTASRGFKLRTHFLQAASHSAISNHALRGGGSSDAVVPTFGGSCPAYSLAVGGGHFAVCTSDKRVFTWAMAGSLTGEDGFTSGQLGHDDIASVRKPKVCHRLV